MVHRNANCFTGWQPHNLHASCCVLTVKNCSVHETIIVACSGGIFPVVGHQQLFIFLFVPFSFFGERRLIHLLHSFHLLSNEKPHFAWWKFGAVHRSPSPPAKWITNHKDKWPAVAADARLRNGAVLLDVYWNKRKGARDWKGRAVGLILHSIALSSSFQSNSPSGGDQ